MATSIRTRRCVWHFRAALAVFARDHADYEPYEGDDSSFAVALERSQRFDEGDRGTSSPSQDIYGPCGSTPIAHALACERLHKLVVHLR